MDEIRVASWIELQDRLYEGSWREELRRPGLGLARWLKRYYTPRTEEPKNS